MKEFRQDPSPPKHCAVRLPVEIMKGRQRGGWERDGWLEWSNVKECEGRDKTQIQRNERHMQGETRYNSTFWMQSGLLKLASYVYKWLTRALDAIKFTCAYQVALGHFMCAYQDLNINEKCIWYDWFFLTVIV